LRSVEAAAPVLGLQLVVMSMDDPEIEGAVSAFAEEPNGGLLAWISTERESADIEPAMGFI
jgi:hypothetical protein